MAIGTVWAAGTWEDTAWADGSWADAVIPSWTVGGYVGGVAVDDAGVMGTEFLDDATAVPSSKVMLAGIAHTQAGLRYVALWPASDEVYYNDGRALRGDGAMIIATSGTPRDWYNGIAMTFRGEMVVSTSAPQLVHMGLGLRQDGSLCVSEAS
jgi:hypothetical protein